MKIVQETKMLQLERPHFKGKFNLIYNLTTLSDYKFLSVFQKKKKLNTHIYIYKTNSANYGEI